MGRAFRATRVVVWHFVHRISFHCSPWHLWLHRKSDLWYRVHWVQQIRSWQQDNPALWALSTWEMY